MLTRLICWFALTGPYNHRHLEHFHIGPYNDNIMEAHHGPEPKSSEMQGQTAHFHDSSCHGTTTHCFLCPARCSQECRTLIGYSRSRCICSASRSNSFLLISCGNRRRITAPAVTASGPNHLFRSHSKAAGKADCKMAFASRAVILDSLNLSMCGMRFVLLGAPTPNSMRKGCSTDF